MTGVIMKLKMFGVLAALAGGLAFSAQPVHAGGRVSIGFGFGGGGGGGYCAPVYQPAYCPPAVTYYSAPPVYYTPAPTYYVPQAPVVYSPAPVYYSAPTYCPAPTYYYSQPRYYTPFSFSIGFGGHRHW